MHPFLSLICHCSLHQFAINPQVPLLTLWPKFYPHHQLKPTGLISHYSWCGSQQSDCEREFYSRYMSAQATRILEPGWRQPAALSHTLSTSSASIYGISQPVDLVETYTGNNVKQAVDACKLEKKTTDDQATFLIYLTSRTPCSCMVNTH